MSSRRSTWVRVLDRLNVRTLAPYPGAIVGDVRTDAVAAAEHDHRLALERRAVLLVGSGGREVLAGQLEQLVDQVDVDRLGDLHVPLVTGDHPDRHVREVAEHDRAVVGRDESGPAGARVRPLDH